MDKDIYQISTKPHTSRQAARETSRQMKTGTRQG